MGFYVGYALSLFGRAQDRLSHVLVPPPYESRKDFFYPRPGAQGRARASGPDPFRPAARRAAGAPARRAARAFPTPSTKRRRRCRNWRSTLDPAMLKVTAGGESFDLKPAQFAFYWMMAERCIAAKGGVHWSERSVGDELLGFCRALGEISEQTERAYRNLDGAEFRSGQGACERRAQARSSASAAPCLTGSWRWTRLPARAIGVSGWRCHPRRSRLPAQACAPGKSARPTENNRP